MIFFFIPWHPFKKKILKENDKFIFWMEDHCREQNRKGINTPPFQLSKVWGCYKLDRGLREGAMLSNLWVSCGLIQGLKRGDQDGEPVKREGMKVKGRTSLLVQWLRIHCQCRGHGFHPWSRNIPQASGHLSPHATTTEDGVLYSLCSTTREATTMRSPGLETKSSPCSPQLEKARSQWRPSAANK